MITISMQPAATVAQVKASAARIAEDAGYTGIAEEKATRKVTDLTAAMVHWRLADLLDRPETEELYQACRHAFYSARMTMMYRHAYHVIERIGAEAKTVSRGVVSEDARPDVELTIRIEDMEERLTSALACELDVVRTAKKTDLERIRAHYRDAAISARRIEDTQTRKAALDKAKDARNLATRECREIHNARMQDVREASRKSPEARTLRTLKEERRTGKQYKHLVTDACEELCQLIVESVLTSQSQTQDYGRTILTSRRRIIAYAVRQYRESLVRSRWMSVDELAAKEYGDQLDPYNHCDGEEQAINYLTLKDAVIAYGMTARHAGVGADVIAAAQAASFRGIAKTDYQRLMQEQLRDAQVLAAIPADPEHHTERKTVMRRIQRRAKKMLKLEQDMTA